MPRLPEDEALAFPLRIGSAGAATCGRAAHVRQQIEQVLFTEPRERVFRPEFGAGLRQMVFEPNAGALWDLTQRRIAASLAEALQGEVDPRSLQVEVDGRDPDTGLVGESARVIVRYRLATIGQEQRVELAVSADGSRDG